jgi:hypothetical protein
VMSLTNILQEFPKTFPRLRPSQRGRDIKLKKNLTKI